ncbi:hypothetical protein HJC23_001928 [Cyclotella cryptica]|uniref:Serine hydrolase domain-containing protein n=1 Tax=Cyclotella cryptica TaxID=29204 RepID=A0ABD3PD21_9STRA|eukprot:CCRYP_015849-RA/>CCRYP_015849-RA protein AED:0.16 eAED:0.16 QI:0/-1/0/1/-1/1/1/0/278
MLMLRSSALLLATLHNPHLATFLTFRSTRLFMTLKNQNQKSGSTPKKKPRILCLHGKFQNAAIFSNKIAGARRKLQREYELQFLDGPIVLPQEQDGDNGEAAGNESSTGECTDDENTPRSWWLRSPDEKSHILVREALEYVISQSDTHQIDAILGFSQGGTLATALALSGAFPNLRCVVTAGAPFVAEAFQEAALLTKECGQAHSDSLFDLGLRIPKFHMAGETDALVAVESTRQLCENGGNGTFVMHDQGHLFPTRSLRVQEVLDFLSKHIDRISPS